MSPSANVAGAVHPERSRFAVIVSVGIVLLTLLAYAPVFANDFIDLDDGDYITENPNVLSGLTRDSVRWAWTTDHHGYWHPLTWLSLQLDVTLFGPHAWGMHLTNLILHAAICVSLFLVFANLTEAFWPSAFLAALFAVHPLHVESVAWAAERKDVLSTFFLVLTVAAYAWTIQRPSLARHLLTAGLFTLGLLAKPMLVTLPFGLLLLDFWPLGRVVTSRGDTVSTENPRFPPRPWWGLLFEKSLLFALAVGFSVITFRLQKEVGSVLSLEVLTPSARVGNALNGYVWYVWKTLVPTHLAVFHVHRMSVPVGEALLSAGVLAALTVFFTWRVRTEPYLIVGWLWFLGTLFPVSGIAQSGEQAYADRFAYVPHIGLFLTLIWGSLALARHRHVSISALAGASTLVLTLAVGLTFNQVRHWRNTETIWEHALAVTPRNYRAHASLSLYHYNQKNMADAVYHMRQALECQEKFPEGYYNLGRLHFDLAEWSEAERNFRLALKWKKDYLDAKHNLAFVLFQQNKVPEGVALLQQVVRRAPDRADSHQLLGIGLAQQGSWTEARQHFEMALKLRPAYPEALHQLGQVHLREGRHADAERFFRDALETRPRYPLAWENLGLALARQDRWADAAAAFAEALRQAPENPSVRGNLALSLHRLGKIDEAENHYRVLDQRFPTWRADAASHALRFATHPEAEMRQGRRALELALQASQATRFGDPISLEALVAAYAELGQFDSARKYVRMALSLAISSPELRDRLAAANERLAANEPIRLPSTRK